VYRPSDKRNVLKVENNEGKVIAIIIDYEVDYLTCVLTVQQALINLMKGYANHSYGGGYATAFEKTNPRL
jgi:hypothetical protein